MKKSIFQLLTLFILLPAIIKAQVPNNDFSKWDTINNYEMPGDWDNLNPLTAAKNVFTCEKGVYGTPENSYLRLASDSVDGIVVPGIAVCGKLDPVTLKPKSGFAYTKRPAALTGKWQFMAMGDDPGFIAVYFTKWNPTTKKREVIGSGVDTLKGMEMAWTSFSIPISFSNPAVPDSCIIFLSSSGPVPIQYSYLFVDDLAFDTGAGIFENSTAVNFKLFPNPVNEVLQLDLRELSDIQSIQVINLQGQIVHSQITTQQTQTIDVSALARGIYFIRVQTKGNVATRKIDKL